MYDLLALSGRDKDKFIQKALERDKVKWNKVTWPLMWSEKKDGVWMAIAKINGEVGIWSRTGERYTSMPHIEEVVHKKFYDNSILLGEAWANSLNHLPHAEAQSIISGWCRDTKQVHEELQPYAFQMLSADEFLKGNQCLARVSFRDRYLTMRNWFSRCNVEQDGFILAEQQVVHSLEEAIALTQAVWNRGGEGGVIRDPNAFFEPGKRIQSIIKLKQGVSFDLEVIGVYEGKTGKYIGTLGGLECRWKNGKTINISGMSDQQRNEWWNNPESIIGRIVQVDAMCLSSKGLLREPRFKGIRTDKVKGDF